MKIFLAAFAAIPLVCFTPIVHAQDDAKRTAAAEELITAMHADALVDLQKTGMKKALEARLPKNLPPDTLKQVQDKIDTGMDAILKDYTWDSVKGDFVALYSHAFTESELKQLIAFYTSPIGKKYIEKRSEIEGGALSIMQKRVQSFMPQIAELVRDTMQSARESLNSPSPAPTPAETAPAPAK